MSAIEWTDQSWNPIVGCSVVSPGCTNCYAMRLAGGRLRHHPTYDGLTEPSKAGPVWNGDLHLVGRALEKPLHWRKPRRIFVNSMGDLFHEHVPDEWIDRCFGMIEICPQHVFQILTKRPDRMRDYIARNTRRQCHLLCKPQWPLPNVWLGTSVEDQARADERIPHLLETPAAVRFLSCEPLLGPVDLRRWMHDWGCESCGYGGDQTDDHCPNCGWKGDRGTELAPCPECGEDLEDYYACPECGATNETGFGVTLSGAMLGYLDWVICGGESGPGARPMHPDWARSLRDQCRAAGVPFFFKQWGRWAPIIVGPDRRELRKADGTPDMNPVGKKAAGRKLDGRTWDELPRIEL